MSFLSGKRALIVGLASNRSIAYGIAQAFHKQGAELAFSYQNEKLQGRVQSIAETLNSSITLPCDVSSDKEIDQLFVNLEKHWNNIDIIVHSVAFAPADQFEDNYLHAVNRAGFTLAHDISSYSFTALAKAGESLLTKGNSALLTLSYIGAERVVANYNVMGVAKASLEANVRYLAYSLGPNGTRVNAVSAGPIRTLAASGIKNFRKILSFNEKVAPLRQNVTIEQVGNTAAFLCSDLASGITGEIIHVDAGIHAVALNPEVK